MSGDGHVTNSVVLEFLSGLSGLTISRCVQGSATTVFHCQVNDGSLAGILIELLVFEISIFISFFRSYFHPDVGQW